MFVVLTIGAAGLVFALLTAASAFHEPGGDAYVKGVILTALSGALGSVLTLIGVIVKGVMDNLTGGSQVQVGESPSKQGDEKNGKE